MPSKLLQLPDELILRILYFLKQSDLVKICLVNKKMKNLALDPKVWTKLKLPNEDLLNHEEAKKLVARCTKLKELNLLHRMMGEEAEMLAIQAMEEGTKLEKLEMDFFSIPLLKALNGNSLLTSLSGCILVTQQNFKDIINHSKYLLNLNELTLSIRWEYPITEEDHQAITDEILDVLGQHCKKLEVINFHFPCSSKGAVSLLSGPLKHTVRKICLMRGEPFCIADVIQVMEKCQQLEHVDLKPPTGQFSSRVLVSIARDSYLLKIFQLNRCRNKR